MHGIEDLWKSLRSGETNESYTSHSRRGFQVFPGCFERNLDEDSNMASSRKSLAWKDSGFHIYGLASERSQRFCYAYLPETSPDDHEPRCHRRNFGRK